MSNQEPDGWATTSPEGEYTGNDSEIILDRSYSGPTIFPVEGYRTFPVCLIDPQELSRLRAIDEWAEWAARELREVYSSTDKPHILKAYDALTEGKP